MVMTWTFLSIEQATEFAKRQEVNGWRVVMSGLQVDLFPGDAGEHEES